jgi:hypothetical protein
MWGPVGVAALGAARAFDRSHRARSAILRASARPTVLSRVEPVRLRDRSRPAYPRLVGRIKLGRVLRRLLPGSDRTAPRLLVALSGRPPSEAAPIFIVGCHRSGTSLLRRIIDSHSLIACPPESKFVLPLVRVLRDDQAMRALASMGYERDAFVESLGRYIDSFFLGYATVKGKPRWADKTPNYVDCLPELWEMFGPSARFVLLVRHGLDVAYSLAGGHRRYPAIAEQVEQAGGDRPIGAARFWRDQNAKLDGFRHEYPDACFMLRYEDVTADPIPILHKLFSFLDEPWEPDVIHHERFPHDAGIEDPEARRSKGIGRRVGASAAWPQELRDKLVSEMKPILETLGYRPEPPV